MDKKTKAAYGIDGVKESLKQSADAILKESDKLHNFDIKISKNGQKENINNLRKIEERLIFEINLIKTSINVLQSFQEDYNGKS